MSSVSTQCELHQSCTLNKQYTILICITGILHIIKFIFDVCMQVVSWRNRQSLM